MISHQKSAQQWSSQRDHQWEISSSDRLTILTLTATTETHNGYYGNSW